MFRVYLLLLCSFVLSYTLYASTIILCRRFGLLDIPDKRKRHSAPVPIGGGAGFIITLIVSVILLYFLLDSYDFLLNVVVALGAFLAIISFIDDIRDLGITIRLLCHSAAAFITTFLLLDYYLCMPQNDSYVLSAYNNMSHWIMLTLIAFFITGFLNIYNFMDGIDGLTGVQTIHIFGNCALLLAINQAFNAYFYTAIIICVISISFLVFNWHPARLFIGDSGSIPIGFFAAFYLVMLAFSGYVLSALLIPLYYFLDGGVTLLSRIIRGDKFWLPHQTHFFQKAMKHHQKHSIIVMKIIIFNIFITILNCIYLTSKATVPWQIVILSAAIGVGIFLLYNFSHKSKKTRLAV